MSKIRYIQGDIIESKADCIVQQVNAVTKTSRGLSASIAKAFPYADLYSIRTSKSEMATVILSEKCSSPTTIAHFVAQLAPGKPGAYCKLYGIDPADDTAEKRLEAFTTCLQSLLVIASEKKWKRVAFPARVACGLAGGDWATYKKLLETFASTCDTTIEIWELAE